MRTLLIFALLLGSLGVMAQTQPSKPAGAVDYGNLWRTPDGNVWAGSAFDSYTNLGTWLKVDSLFKLGYTKEQVDSAITVNISFLNVKTFGAIGDGVTDDTEAIRDAMDYLKTSGDGRLFFPEGVYMISGTVYIPSGVEIFGDGKEKSIVRNLPDAEPDLIIPYGDFGNTQAENNYKYLTMWATETADQSVVDSVHSVIIHDMGFDWNGVECGVYSALEVLIGSAVDCHLYNIHFFPVLPSDLDGINVSRRGRCLLFAFAQDCSVSNSVVNASDYESVGAWYLSKSIRIHNNLFDIDKPDGFRNQNHAVQMATPPLIAPDLIAEYGESQTGPVYIYNNTFLMKRRINHAVTSHTGKGLYLFNNYVKGFSTVGSPWGFKPFDGAEDFIIAGNTIDYTEVITASEGVTAISLNSTENDHAQVRNGIITGNLVKIKQDLATQKPAIGGDEIESNNIKIEGNIIEIHGYADLPNKGISAYGTDISIKNNSIRYIDPVETITSSGPVAISTKTSSNLSISGNIISGDDIATGVSTQSGSNGLIYGNISNNALQNVSSSAAMQVDWVNTTTNQVAGGVKTWTERHTWIPTNTGNPSPVANSIEIIRPGLTQMAIRGGNSSAIQSFALRTYASSGIQLTLNDGGVEAQNFKLSSLNTAPASATAPGTTGEIRITATYIYVCTATNTWVRAALATW